jgi:hypothetical protein
MGRGAVDDELRELLEGRGARTWATVVTATGRTGQRELSRLLDRYLAATDPDGALDVWADEDGMHIRPRSIDEDVYGRADRAMSGAAGNGHVSHDAEVTS